MNNYYLLDRIAGRDPSVRASDADRERVAERLRSGHAEGRLDTDEFQERLEHCYQAKTLGELRELVSDLPRPEERDEHGALSMLRLARWPLVPLAPIVIALLFVSAAVGHHFVWLWIPVVFLLWRMSWWRRRRWMAGARRGPDDWL